MRIRSLIVFLIFFISTGILWFLCPAVAKIPAMDGHLSCQGQNSETPGSSINPSATPEQSQGGPEPLFNYFTLKENESDFDLSMHILEINPANPKIITRPVSAHETLFGYATLSDMNAKWKSLATVNGGFSHPNGLLGGLYAINGELITTATGKYPALFMRAGKAFIEDVETAVWLEGQTESSIKLESLYYNQFPKGDGLYVFTPAYGSQNRIESSHLNAVVSKGEVRGLLLRNGSYEIPQDGFLVSAIGDYAKIRLKEAVKPGMQLKISYEVHVKRGKIESYDWAYECGSWILRDGQVVVPDADTWVGTLRIRTPRTAVGIKQDGTLVFVVVDGRQKDFSDGLSGEELAQKLLVLGIKDAVFLDGGASSEMIVEGKIVNSPAAGRERLLASGFVILQLVE